MKLTKANLPQSRMTPNSSQRSSTPCSSSFDGDSSTLPITNEYYSAEKNTYLGRVNLVYRLSRQMRIFPDLTQAIVNHCEKAEQKEFIRQVSAQYNTFFEFPN